MKRLASLVPAALLVTGALSCTDKVEKPVPTAPTVASPVAAAAPAPVANGSTVCLSYVTKRASAVARLKHARERLAEHQSDDTEKLVKKAEAEAEKLAEIAADACN